MDFLKMNKTTMLKLKGYTHFSKLVFNRFRIGEVHQILRNLKPHDHSFI